MSNVQVAALTDLADDDAGKEAAQRMGVSRAAVRKAAAHEQFQLPRW